jgi:protease-4
MTKSTKWFIGILAVLILFVIGFSFFFLLLISTTPTETEYVTNGTGEKVGLVEIAGIISESWDIVRQLKDFREDNSIRAVLLRIDSPGGGVVASQEIYEEVRKVREAGKPVVVSMGSVTASGGYYVACGATRLVANRGTLTGSIGVIAEFLQLRDALSKLGIDVKTIKSGRLKDAGSPTRKMTSEDEAYFQSLLDDVHDQFIEIVERERNLRHEEVLRLADGRVFTGEHALKIGLVDTLGTLEDAIAIAAELAGIEGEPTVIKERVRRRWWERIIGYFTETLSGVRREWMDRPILSFRYVGPS